MSRAREALDDALRLAIPAVLVRVEAAYGSTPREVGAAMLVTLEATHGTVGGGALEMEAVLHARRMIEAGTQASELDIALGPAIGQCCGGRVRLALERASPALARRLERADEAEHAAFACVFVFGAGHTGQALSHALLPLPFRLCVVDTRAERLAELAPGVPRIHTALPEALIDSAPPASAFVILTHDHALDFLLAARALERGDAAYVGMIGSATKRAKFARHLQECGSAGDIGALTLPIGGAKLRDKRPAVIAALTAAELLHRLRPWGKTCTGFAQGQNECNKEADEAASRRVRESERHAATP